VKPTLAFRDPKFCLANDYLVGLGNNASSICADENGISPQPAETSNFNPSLPFIRTIRSDLTRRQNILPEFCLVQSHDTIIAKVEACGASRGISRTGKRWNLEYHRLQLGAKFHDDTAGRSE
jgi:hypothetical protein